MARMAYLPRHALIWLPAGLGLIAGASLALAQAPGSRPARLTQAESARCLAQHGQIAIAGLSGEEMCALPYADAGRRCTDSAQCLGDCRYQGPLRPGARAAGQCQAYQYPYGCRTTVERGRVTEGPCFD